jgi:hypothetical protein
MLVIIITCSGATLYIAEKFIQFCTFILSLCFIHVGYVWYDFCKLIQVVFLDFWLSQVYLDRIIFWLKSKVSYKSKSKLWFNQKSDFLIFNVWYITSLPQKSCFQVLTNILLTSSHFNFIFVVSCLWKTTSELWLKVKSYFVWQSFPSLGSEIPLVSIFKRLVS